MKSSRNQYSDSKERNGLKEESEDEVDSGEDLIEDDMVVDINSKSKFY